MSLKLVQAWLIHPFSQKTTRYSPIIEFQCDTLFRKGIISPPLILDISVPS